MILLLTLVSIRADSIKFDFLVTSDTHDAIGGYNIEGYADWGDYTYFSKEYVKKHPNVNVLNLFSGDICEGRTSNNPTEEYPYPCQGIIEAMADNGIETIFTGGNHDIDTKETTLYYMKTFDDPNNFWGDRFVTANIIRTDNGNEYGTAKWITREFKTTEGNPFKVAILGMLDQTWGYMADTVKVISIDAAFKNDEFKSFVQTEKPDLFIVLGHYGGHLYDEETKEFISNPQTYELGTIIREYSGNNVPLHFLLGHVHVLQSSDCGDGNGNSLDNCWSYCSDGYFEHASIVHLNLTKNDNADVFTATHNRDAFVPTITNFKHILETDTFVLDAESQTVSNNLAKLNKDTQAFDIVGRLTVDHDWIYPTPTNGIFAWNKTSLVRLFFEKVYPAVFEPFGDIDLFILNSGTFKENLYHNIDKDQISGIYPYTENPITLQMSAEALYYVVNTANPPAGSVPSDWSDYPLVNSEHIVNRFNYYFTSLNISKLELGKMYTVGACNFDIGNILKHACADNKCGDVHVYKSYELKSLIDNYVVNDLYPLNADAVTSPQCSQPTCCSAPQASKVSFAVKKPAYCRSPAYRRLAICK